MLIALLCATLVLGAGWAWCLQRAALRLLDRRTSHAGPPETARVAAPTGAAVIPGRLDSASVGSSSDGTSGDGSPGDGSSGDGSAARGSSGELALAQLAVRQVPDVEPSLPSSVLGWDAFAISSTMVLEGTALIGCSRRFDPDFPPPATRLPARDGVEPEIGSFVLLIGEDERAAQAYDLLELWRETESVLWLRPTQVSGAVEVYDRQRRALRACLLVA